MVQYNSYLGYYGYYHNGDDDSNIKYFVKNVPNGFDKLDSENKKRFKVKIFKVL